MLTYIESVTQIPTWLTDSEMFEIQIVKPFSTYGMLHQNF